jgi:hypothetical protein
LFEIEPIQTVDIFAKRYGYFVQVKLGEKIEMTDRRIWRRLEQQGIKMQYFAFRYSLQDYAKPCVVKI